MAKNDSDIDVPISEVLKEATKILNDAYQHRREPFPLKDSEEVEYVKLSEESKNGTLVFPRFFHGKAYKTTGWTRISEQELRFAFVQAFNELVKDYFYGVEVPTKDRYIFSDSSGKDENIPRIATEEDIKERTGRRAPRSGSFDMVIYNDKLERVCLIEFKYGHPDKGSFAKDFLKLANPKEGKEETKRYFIHMMKDKADDIDIKTTIQDYLSVDITNVIYESVVLENKERKILNK